MKHILRGSLLQISASAYLSARTAINWWAQMSDLSNCVALVNS